ncbi:MAG: FG-GAP-like repeat-containing protein [Planctomycetota bacterium]
MFPARYHRGRSRSNARRLDRSLQVESLEKRQLLAVDVVGAVKITDGSILTGADGITGTSDDLTVFLSDGDRLGASLTAADLDGDGRNELVMGLPDARGGEGEIRILRFNADGTPGTDFTLADGINGIAPGSIAAGGARFGTSFAILDRPDGSIVVAIGAPGTDQGSDLDAGEVHLLTMDLSTSPNPMVTSQSTLSASLVNAFLLQPGDQFGSVLVVGDTDANGFNELFAGAPGVDIGGAEEGAAYGFEYETSPLTIMDVFRISSETDEDLDDVLIDEGDRIGNSVALLGDLGGGSLLNVVVGAPGDDGASGADPLTDTGAVYLVDDTLSTVKIVPPEGSFGEQFGTSVSVLTDLPDIDEDGLTDIIVGSPFSLVGGPNLGGIEGSISLLGLVPSGASSIQRIDSTDAALTGSISGGDEFGSSVAILGDLNGDGTVEVAVGAPGDDTGSLPSGSGQRGAVHILSLEPVAAGFVLPTSGSVTTSENATTVSVSIALQREPTSNVTLGVGSSDVGEVFPSPGTYTFTPSNWNVPQTLNLTGVDDLLVDGDQLVDITISVTSSDDTGYQNLDPGTFSVTNLDDDVAGFQISSNPSLLVSEDGLLSDIASVTLDTQPMSNVVVTVTPSDTTEVDVSLDTLTFTPSNWNIPQAIDIVGVDDVIVDGDIASDLIFAIDAIASDPLFSGVASQTIGVITEDDDLPGFEVSSSPDPVVSENGQVAEMVDVVLTVQPQSDVVITITPSDTTEVEVELDTLTFTPSNWDLSQSINVFGVFDFIVDGDVASDLTFAVDTIASDPQFSGVADVTIVVTTLDDDVAGFVVSGGPSLLVSEDGQLSESVEVALAAEPQSDVVITITPSDLTEVDVDLDTLTFSPNNWDIPQQVTVFGEDDLIVDGDVDSDLTFAIDTIASDPLFSNVPDEMLGVTTEDDDVSIGVGTVIGVVFRDENLNGVVDGATETGIAGVVVFSDLNQNGQLDPQEPSTVSDASGAYVLLGVPIGLQSIRQVDPDGFIALGDPQTTFVIDGTVAVDLPNVPLVTLSGVVFEDVNGNQLLGNSESTSPGFDVDLFEVRNGQSTLLDIDFTDASGRYTFSNLLPAGIAFMTPDGMVTGPDRYEIIARQTAGGLDASNLEQTTPLSGSFSDPELIPTGVTLPFDRENATTAQQAQLDTFNQTGQVSPNWGWGTGVLSGQLAIGDFDNDGDDDVAVANETSDLNNQFTTITVLRNDQGTLSVVQEIPVMEDSPRLTSIAIGDLNADGRDDLIFGSLGRRETDQDAPGNYVAAFLNVSGVFTQSIGFDTNALSLADGDSGAPTAAQLAALTSRVAALPLMGTFSSDPMNGPQAIAVADVIGDGSIQILTANAFSTNVSIIAPENGMTTGVAALNVGSDRPTKVTVAEIDGDGIDDVLIANASGHINVVLSARPTGSATGLYRFDSTLITDDSSRPRPIIDIDIADINGDGDKEIVVTAWPSKDIEIFDQDASDDDTQGQVFVIELDDLSAAGGADIFDFDIMETIGVGRRPTAIATGDVNRTVTSPPPAFGQQIDLIVVDESEGSLQFLLNTPGGFVSGPSFPTTRNGEGFINPQDVTLRDIDGDGRLDALVANLTNGISILRGQQGRHQITPTVGETRDDLDFGFTSIPTGSTAPSGEPFTNGVNPFDVNNDGAVTSLDALRIINRLDAGLVQGESVGASDPVEYLDVSGDGRVSALDALMVINELNRQPPRADTSSEPLMTPDGGTDGTWHSLVDEVWATTNAAPSSKWVAAASARDPRDVSMESTTAEFANPSESESLGQSAKSTSLQSTGLGGMKLVLDS